MLNPVTETMIIANRMLRHTHVVPVLQTQVIYLKQQPAADGDPDQHQRLTGSVVDERVPAQLQRHCVGEEDVTGADDRREPLTHERLTGEEAYLGRDDDA